MAKRGMRKGSRCLRHHKSGPKKGRCAEYGKSGKARKAAAPKKRKGGGKSESWLKQMERRYGGKKGAKLYTSAPDFAARMRADREAAQAKRLQENISSLESRWGEEGLYGARRRRRRR